MIIKIHKKMAVKTTGSINVECRLKGYYLGSSNTLDRYRGSRN